MIFYIRIYFVRNYALNNGLNGFLVFSVSDFAKSIAKSAIFFALAGICQDILFEDSMKLF